MKTPLPSGNPNLIKMAKRRQTVKSETAGSGLNCTVSIQMICEWEQKFISGIDPTIAWQDILGKILTFATSRSNNYGLKASFEKTIKRWMDYPETIVKDMVEFIKEGLKAAKDEIEKMIQGVKETLAPSKSKEEVDKKAEADKAAALDKLKDVTADSLIDDLLKGLSRQLNKYRIVIEGIARALSGAPSTPWHITIGNPLRPIFCSGDMYMEQDLALDLGPTLAFNDLPSNIKASFTLTNARPWGLQEIAAKFNAGSIRVVTIVKDANDLNQGETLQDQIYVTPTTGSKTNPTNTTATTNAVAGAAAPGAVAGVAGATVPTTVPQVPPAIATVAAGPQLPPPVPTFANNFNTDISTAAPNLTAGAAANVASAQNSLDGVTAAVNSGQAQAEALAARATAAANEAAAASGTTTGGAINAAIEGAVAAAQGGVAATQNAVATTGANVGSVSENAGRSVESVNTQSVVADANSSIGTTLQNINWSGFAL